MAMGLQQRLSWFAGKTLRGIGSTQYRHRRHHTCLETKNGRARSTGGPHKKGDISPKVEFFNRQLRQAMSEFAQDSQETEPAI
jgi:hypothetical protein